mmetsp:Transcript_68477/g.135325  ORF Transcript_68477/g.135325 Transcript_68477/m.135325 type:complete len:104 (-) Transcript_68477:175-486(-)
MNCVPPQALRLPSFQTEVCARNTFLESGRVDPPAEQVNGMIRRCMSDSILVSAALRDALSAAYDTRNYVDLDEDERASISASTEAPDDEDSFSFQDDEISGRA